jgi:hypothetical protein
MADIEKLIKQADTFIKQEKYAEAWKLLLPHKDDENARKRLKWLKAKREQLQIESEIAAAPVKMKNASWFRRLDWRIKLVLGVFILCGGCYCFGVSGQILGFIPDSTEFAATTEAALTENAPTLTNTPTNTLTPTASNTSSPEPSATASPSETITPAPSVTLTASATSAPSATHTPSATFTATASATITNTPQPSATNTPPPPTATYSIIAADVRENLDSLELRLLEHLEQTEGLDFIQTLSIQTMNNYTIVFAEIVVYPPHNTVAIPQGLREVAIGALGRSDFETFVNMSDGRTATAYTWFPDGRSSIVPYTSGVVPPTPRPR